MFPAPTSSLLALSALLLACGDAPLPRLDIEVVPETTAVELAPETVDSAAPELPEVEVETIALPETTEDTGPEVARNPFDEADPSPPFLPPDPPPVAPLGCPALVNAGGELGNLTGWNVLDGTFVATTSFAYAGGYVFRAGTSEHSSLAQDVDVSAFTSNVPAGEERFAHLSAFMRGADEGTLRLSAIGAGGEVLAERQNGPYLSEEWRQGELALALPAGTAKVRVELIGQRLKGTENNAYFDEAKLCVYAEPPTGSIDELLGPPYLMNVTPNSVSVMFETRAPTWSAVDYGTSPDRLDHTETLLESATTHILRIEGLTPFTRYYYRVRYADLALPPYDFLTARAPDDKGRIELIMFADNQEGPDVFRELAKQMAAFDPDFILHAGDVVQNGTRIDYRNQFFAPFFGLGNHAAVVLGPGNHETYSSAILTSNESRALWEEYVDQPNDEHCFGFRWGQLFVMVIDTERPHGGGTPQYACIESTLNSESAKSATFRAALFHRAPLVEFWDPVAGVSSETAFFTFEMDAPDVRYYLAPLFQRARVQLVFNGHNHLYQFVPRWPEFTAWVTSGGGGGGLESGTPESQVNDWSPFVEKQIFGRFHFLRVIIEGELMWVRAIGDQGDVLHEFQIKR